MASLSHIAPYKASCFCSDCGSDCEESMQLNCGKHFICKMKCFPNRFATIERKEDVLCCSACYDISIERGIFIFVDDSNIWIEAKKLQSKLKCYKTGEDHRVRLDVGRLTDVLACDRPVEQGVLYGSEPPPVDTVWKKIEERGWRVERDKRHTITGKEKKVDTRLVAEATGLAIRTPVEKRTTIVLVTGDADVIPAIEQILKEAHWKVEVCMWKQAMSRELTKFAGLHSERVQIKNLDDFLDNVSFTNMRFDVSNRKIHHLVTAYGVVFTIEEGAFHKNIPTRSWLNQLESIAQWPCQYYWFTFEDLKTNDLVVVFKRDSTAGEFNIDQFLADIQLDADKETERYRLPSTLKVQSYQQYLRSVYKGDPNEQLEKIDAALEQVGIYTNDEAIAGSDNEVVYECDSSDGWTTYRRKPRRHNQLRQRYSERCPYLFNCKFGTRCQYQHSEAEKTDFRGRIEGRGNPLRKVRPCVFFEKVPPSCTKQKNECDYAHGADDAWCLNCVCTGHFTDQCNKQKTNTV